MSLKLAWLGVDQNRQLNHLHFVFSKGVEGGVLLQVVVRYSWVPPFELDFKLLVNSVFSLVNAHDLHQL